jgi:hypothetical protein
MDHPHDSEHLYGQQPSPPASVSQSGMPNEAQDVEMMGDTREAPRRTEQTTLGMQTTITLPLRPASHTNPPNGDNVERSEDATRPFNSRIRGMRARLEALKNRAPDLQASSLTAISSLQNTNSGGTPMNQTMPPSLTTPTLTTQDPQVQIRQLQLLLMGVDRENFTLRMQNHALCQKVRNQAQQINNLTGKIQEMDHKGV